MYLQYQCKQPVSLYPALQWYNQPAIGAEWLFNGTGVGASNQFEAGGFIRSSEEFDWPNIQYHFLPVAINYNGSNAVKSMASKPMSVQCVHLHVVDQAEIKRSV
jgi:choline dehydrogenase